MTEHTTPDPYDPIAAWYDLEHADFLDDLELYQGLAEAAGDPILEVGCGSGRLLLPLAEAGWHITGVDLSATMLARCRAVVDAAGMQQRVTLVPGDMTALVLPERNFHLAFIALGSAQHLATMAERRSALAALRAHVMPGGWLALDLAQAEPRRFAQAAETGEVLHIGTWHDAATGTILTHTAAARIGTAPGALTLTHWYDAHPQNGPLTRACVETTLATVTRNEIELLLTATGWRLRQVYGDHALDEWDDLSPRLIIVAQAAEQ
jgi:SAM-dependent methyltransferase